MATIQRTNQKGSEKQNMKKVNSHTQKRRTVMAALLALLFSLSIFSSFAVTASAGVLDAWLPFELDNSLTSGAGSLTGSSGVRHTGYIADVSKFQGDVNFSQMRNAGVEGVMIRAAYANKKDIKFDEYTAGADSANLPYGSYQFATFHYGTDYSTALSKADTQAHTFINILRGKNVRGFVALDLELESGATVVMSKSELTNCVNYYLSLIENAGYKPILYCSISWLCNRLNESAIQYPLWVAYYNDTGSFEFPNTTYGDAMRSFADDIYMWQYTSKANGPNYGCESQNLDMSRLYRSFT